MSRMITPREQRNYSTKLTPEEVLEAKRLHKDEGLGWRRLWKRFPHVTQTAIRKAVTGRTWAHLR